MDKEIEKLLTKERTLRVAASDAAANHGRVKMELDTIQSRCNHRWGPTTREVARYPGYHISGDPPGTMGVDRQLPMDVPPSEEIWFQRVCLNCGKIERAKTYQPSDWRPWDPSSWKP